MTTDHQKCQYCTEERVCSILREECLMDNPDELKCKEMYNIPFETSAQIFTHMKDQPECVYDDNSSEEDGEIKDEIYDY